MIQLADLQRFIKADTIIEVAKDKPTPRLTARPIMIRFNTVTTHHIDMLKK